MVKDLFLMALKIKLKALQKLEGFILNVNIILKIIILCILVKAKGCHQQSVQAYRHDI